jgi:hypothetical protein
MKGDRGGLRTIAVNRGEDSLDPGEDNPYSRSKGVLITENTNIVKA